MQGIPPKAVKGSRASLPGMYFPASLPDEVGLASCRSRHCSTDVPQCSASDLRAVFHPREAGIATWRGLRQPCVPACSSPALRPLMLLSAMRLILERFFIPAKPALRPTEGGICSTGDLLVHHFLAKPALRPGMFFAGIVLA